MKEIFFAFAGLIFSLNVFANQIWQQLSGPSGGNIKTMIYFNGNYYISCELNQNLGGVWKLLPNNTWINISYGLPKPYASSFAQIDTTLFAACDTSIMKTTDGGTTWSDASGNLPPNTWVKKLVLHNNILFATIFYGTGMEEVFFTTNKGITWASTGFSMMTSFNQFYSYGNKLWLATNHGVYMLTNNGLTWTFKNNNIPFSANIYSIISKGDTMYCGTSNGVYYSLNGADLWMQAANGLPASTTVVNSFTISGNLCYAATQSNGVYSTVIGANNWSVAGTGLPQYTNVNSIISTSNSLAIGTFDGFYMSSPVGNTWTLVNNGLNCAYVRSVYAEGNTLIASIGTNSGLFISTNGGYSWTQCGITNSIYVRKIIKAANKLFAASSNGIYVSQDGGFNWSISNIGITGVPHCISYNGAKYFAGTSTGLFQSNNGSSWSQITVVPSQSVVDIATSGNTVYAISGGQKVYVSNNSGNNWQNQSYGLPISTPLLQSVVISDSMAVVSCMYGAYRKSLSDTTWINPNTNQAYIDLLAVSGSHLFATSSNNVKVSNDFGKTWYNFELGLAPYIGSKICIFATDTVVYIGSEIGGIWRININPELTVNTISGMPLCGGGSIAVGMSTNATYYQGNKFYIQLSDKMGRFTNPIKIDSIVSNTLPSTKISSLPSNIEQGSNYRIRVMSTNPFVVSKEYSANIVINQKVSVLIHPANQNSCIGGNSGFYCGATGSGITYQWQVDSGLGFVNLSNNAIYQGVNSELLLISNITLAMNGYKYRCLLSGYCPPAITSNFGLLSVGLAPNIILHPVDTNVCNNTQAKFSIQASGINISYQWQCDFGTGSFSNISNNSTYSGVNTNTLTVYNAQITMDGYKYRCLLSSCLPSNAATLNIMPVPVIAPLNNITACLNGTAAFTAVVIGTVANYQWQVNYGVGFVNIYNNTVYQGTDSGTLVISVVTNDMNDYQYRCLINTYCFPYYYQTNTATLSVNPNSPSISMQPQNASVCENDKALFYVSASGSGLSYQWQYNTGNAWINVPNSTPFYGANDDTLRIDTVKMLFNGYKFRCFISFCQYSDSATIIVYPKPIVSVTPLSQLSFCLGDSVDLTCNQGVGWVFNWFKNNQPITISHSNSITVYQSGMYKVEAVTPFGCKDTSSSVQVDVFALPNLFIGYDTLICTGENLVIYAGNTYSSYLWSNNSQADSIVVNNANFGMGYHQIWVKVVDINGCVGSDTILVTIVNCNSVRNVSFYPYNIYPLPTSDYLNIDLPYNDVNIQFFSFDGKLIFDNNYENKKNISILTKWFKPGVYLIKIKSDKEIKLFKIIKV